VVSRLQEFSAANPTLTPHPRRISWVGATALALGGSNQSIFLIGALLASQGSAAIPLLAIGLLLAYMATPGWIELSCMFPNRVGGIAATCAEAFRPYSAVLANLTGVCYWWGWIPTCGLTAIFSADAIHQWYLPGVPTKLIATLLVLGFMGVNLCGLKWAVRVAVPIAAVAALLAFASSLIPVFAGSVNWHQATDFHLASPFAGAFGKLTSAMAGLYLVGFAAPAFEAAACHIGEMRIPSRDQPRAMWTSGIVASLYFVFMPIVWLGVFGSTSLQGNLATVLGPTFAPLFGSLAKAAAIWFVAFNMFSGTIQPLSGSSRTLSQLSQDGLLPRSIGYRSQRTDAPVVAIVVTATASIIFLLAGDPTSVIAAANLTYLIGIALPSIAVWILRRNEPERTRTYRAHDWSIRLGVIAAFAWLATTVLGFEQFGLPFVIFGLALAYSGSIAYAWRVHFDRKMTGIAGPRRSLHLKLTGAMLAVLTLDGIGYLIAVSNVSTTQPILVAILKDIFVAVGLLTITVGLILPGMISHTANQVSVAAKQLSEGTLLDLTTAMEALSTGDLDRAEAHVEVTPVDVRTRDEFGEMAAMFNVMQDEIVRAATAVDTAADELRTHRDELERLVAERTAALTRANEGLQEARGQRRELLDRMRALTSRIGSRTGERPDLDTTTCEVVAALGSTMAVDAVMVELADDHGRLEYAGTIWNRRQDAHTVQVEAVPDAIRNALESIAESHEALAISDVHGALPDAVADVIRDYARASGMSALLVCPFYTSDTNLLGVVALARSVAGEAWTEDDVALVETVAADFARAVVSAKVFEDQQRLVRQLQELDTTKGEMLSTFSHELRTPLASIRAYVELLREGDERTAEEEDRMLEVIERNTTRLSSLIEDILTLSHLSSEVYDAVLAELFIDPLVQSVADALRPGAEEKHITFEVHLDASGTHVLGEPSQLERLFFNLLSNAIKFTPSGGSVTVVTSATDRTVTITVTDSGIGIPEAEQGKVYERFYRGSNATDSLIPGTGLGLAIAEAIVEHHGGRLTHSSAPGQGTIATVVLPAVAQSSQAFARIATAVSDRAVGLDA
jgi:signal transduction histidine kinase/amino acid transporter/HAMP domain-containing protein